MAMTWTPERAGNWLFHCHVMTHVSPSLLRRWHAESRQMRHEHHASAGMTGMVLGISVLPRPGTGARHRNEPEHL